jgi:glycosyltransferase involved in cell wall biosynthesis
MTQPDVSPTPIRVAHVVRQLDVGGMEKLLVEFARNADREHFALRFVSLTRRGPLADDLEASGWPIEALEQPAGLRPGLSFRLAGLFRHWDIDIVHTHNNAPFLYGAPAARLAGVPGLIHTRHGQNFRSGRRQALAFRLTSLLADRVVCVSRDSARLSAREGVTRAKLRTLWNGIDLSRFSYLGPQRDGPAVMVARLSPEKDAASLVVAAALVARQRPGFRLEIAGNGACFPDLQRLVAAEGLGDRVRLLGEVRDVPAVLARASLFVLPSLSEGVSLTLLEAMARGLPVVATRVGGNPEVVDDGRTGFLVPAASPAALAEKIVYLLDRPELAREMGLEGRRRVEEHFNVRAMVGQYEALYRQVLRRAPARSPRSASPVPEEAHR